MSLVADWVTAFDDASGRRKVFLRMTRAGAQPMAATGTASSTA